MFFFYRRIIKPFRLRISLLLFVIKYNLRFYSAVNLIRHPSQLISLFKRKGFRRILKRVVQILFTRKSIDRTIENSIDFSPFQFDCFRILLSPTRKPTINLIIDSLGKESIYGGVLTSITIAVYLSKQLGFKLRIVTTKDSYADNSILKSINSDLSSIFSDIEVTSITEYSTTLLEVSQSDIYIPTSSWNCHKALASFPHSKIFYLIQEDERLFFPSGDLSNLAQIVMANRSIKFIVNTESLRKGLIASGLDNFDKLSISFEPSFYYFTKSIQDRQNKDRRNVISFYARPNHPRNMFKTGMKALTSIYSKGLLQDGDWKIELIGDCDLIPMIDSVKFSFLPKMNLEEYTHYLRTVRLGVALMASIHPGYPIFDFAASGIVGITNKWPNKFDLTNVSKNIFMSEPSSEDLEGTILKCMKLLTENKIQNIGSLTIPYSNSWDRNLKDVLSFVRNNK